MRSAHLAWMFRVAISCVLLGHAVLLMLFVPLWVSAAEAGPIDAESAALITAATVLVYVFAVPASALWLFCARRASRGLPWARSALTWLAAGWWLLALWSYLQIAGAGSRMPSVLAAQLGCALELVLLIGVTGLLYLPRGLPARQIC